MNKRIDLHTHSLFSDGELLPSELARRAEVLGHSTIAITDHVDMSKLDIINKIVKAAEDVNDNWNIKVITGVEITHVPTQSIAKIAKKSKDLGAEIVLVHGETLAEPVISGTNLAAIECEYVDVLAHPGIINEKELELAVNNDIYLELSGRKGHSLSNGHIANLGLKYGANFLINSDGHAPEDLMNYETGKNVGLGAGLNEKETEKALMDNPKKLLKHL
ncbi:MAG: histidinol phosphate phosphatase domain-containing protein [Methanobrevibacter sp.]|nr:histidinol phosphate phosphatase domain-containing protein [Candidatus Methanoflexus mossambicus]